MGTIPTGTCTCIELSMCSYYRNFSLQISRLDFEMVPLQIIIIYAPFLILYHYTFISKQAQVLDALHPHQRKTVADISVNILREEIVSVSPTSRDVVYCS